MPEYWIKKGKIIENVHEVYDCPLNKINPSKDK